MDHMAIVIYAQLRHSYNLLEQATTKLKAQSSEDDEKVELRGKSEELEKSLVEREQELATTKKQLQAIRKDLDKSKNLLKQAFKEIKDLPRANATDSKTTSGG